MVTLMDLCLRMGTRFTLGRAVADASCTMCMYVQKSEGTESEQKSRKSSSDRTSLTLFRGPTGTSPKDGSLTRR